MIEIVRTLRGLFNPEVLVENSFLFAILSIFLVMYGPRLHVRLPHTVKALFDSAVFRGVVLFLIAYMSNSDFVGALTITVIFIVTINILQSSEILSKMAAAVTKEHFSANGPSVANCNTYNAASSNQVGTVFYPLHDNESAEKTRDGNHGTPEYNAAL
mgnify:FL=1